MTIYEWLRKIISVINMLFYIVSRIIGAIAPNLTAIETIENLAEITIRKVVYLNLSTYPELMLYRSPSLKDWQKHNLPNLERHEDINLMTLETMLEQDANGTDMELKERRSTRDTAIVILVDDMSKGNAKMIVMKLINIFKLRGFLTIHVKEWTMNAFINMGAHNIDRVYTTTSIAVYNKMLLTVGQAADKRIENINRWKQKRDPLHKTFVIVNEQYQNGAGLAVFASETGANVDRKTAYFDVNQVINSWANVYLGKGIEEANLVAINNEDDAEKVLQYSGLESIRRIRISGELWEWNVGDVRIPESRLNQIIKTCLLEQD